jgi:hypothetical protein
MATFLRTTTLWVVDFRYEGRARRWIKGFAPDIDVHRQAAALLRDLYGGRAQLAAVRAATAEEELQYLRGDEPRNAFCPTGRTRPAGDEPRR